MVSRMDAHRWNAGTRTDTRFPSLEVLMTDLSIPISTVESTLREAGRQHRKVRARIRFDSENGGVVVFSLFRNEFRTIPLADIKRVELSDDEFRPRRPIEM
jgi:hypothetical protein